MKSKFLTLGFFFLLTTLTFAQTQIKYATVCTDSLLQYAPAYQEAQAEIKEVRAQFEAEIQYVESKLQAELAEYLAGQTTFSEPILLKRQRDLQDHLSAALAFRAEADSLLLRAEQQILALPRAQVQEALQQVGVERGYEAIFDRAAASVPFLHPSCSEDATPFVIAKLKK